MSRPLLDGLRVLDVARVFAGPYATQLMGDLGADVVKVEFPAGDPTRGVGPFVDGRSLYFSSVNSGKRGVVLDPRTDPGREALDALIERSDIVVQNFRPSAAASLGLTPQSLLDRHPRLIVVTISSFGSDSERAEEAAYDLTAQAESGIMSVTGEQGRPPVRAGVPVSDVAASLWAVIGACSALFARERDGVGRTVEVPLMDASVSFLSYMATAALATSTEPPPVGSGHHVVCPYGAFPTRDGWVAVAVFADKFWIGLCEAIGLDDFLDRADLRHNEGRFRRRDEVDARIAEALSRFSTAEAVERLRRFDIPHAPVLSILEALAAPYVQGRNIVSEISSPEGTYRVVTGPLGKFGSSRPAPALGEHTEEVLTEVLGPDSAVLREVVARAEAAHPR